MSLFKKLAGQTAVYGLSSVLGRMLNYLLVPLYTAVFSPREYGVVTELYAYVAFLNILYIYGMETAYFRFSSEESGDRYFNLAVTSILVSSFLCSGTIWLFSDSIASAFGYEGQQSIIQWLSLILAIDAVVAIPFARLRQRGKAMRFAGFKLSNIGVNIFLNLFFILWLPGLANSYPESVFSSVYDPALGVGYVFLANLIANGLYLLFFIPDWARYRPLFAGVDLKRMLNYAWPVLIIGFAGVTNEMLSRAILKYRLPEQFYEGYSNLEILGIFGACYKLAVFMSLAIQAFRYAFEPFFFAQAKSSDSPLVFKQVMTWFVIFTSFAWLVLCLFMPFYAPVFLRQDSYLKALDAVPLLLGGGLFLGVFYNLSLWYKLTDKTIYGAYISLLGAAVTFALNWLLIPYFGYMGSALVTFITYFSMTVISYLWGRRHYPVPYDLGRILAYIGVAAILIGVYSISEQTLPKAILLTLIFLILLVILERKTFLRFVIK